MADYALSALAEQDLDDIATYTTQTFGASKARAYKAALIQSAEIAASFPLIGRTYTTKKGSAFQMYSVGRHAIFYRPSDTGIYIVRVLHLTMDFDRHLE